MLWFLGLPAGSSQNDLALGLSVTDQNTRDIIWEGDYNLDHKITQGLYYKLGHDVRAYPYLMQDILNAAIQDMHREFQAREME